MAKSCLGCNIKFDDTTNVCLRCGKPTKSQEYLDSLYKLHTMHWEHLMRHEATLMDCRSKTSGASSWPSFHECLSEIRDILLILKATHKCHLTRLGGSSDDSHLSEVRKHPHWDLVFSKMFEKLYPAVSLMPSEQINMTYIPITISYDVMLKELLDPSDPQRDEYHLNDPTVVSRYIGVQATTTSEYLSNWKHNIYRLVTIKTGKYEEIPFQNGPAEIAIFYVATYIGVQRAIEYLEALWNDGWLYGVNLYSGLWLGLQMWHRSHPEESTYRKGREKYVKEIVLFGQYTSTPIAELLTAARDLLKRTKNILHEDRVKAPDLSYWIRCIHKHWLPFTGIAYLKHIAESYAPQNHLLTELTQIWRYCKEATADIEGFIANPFAGPLSEMVRSIIGSPNKIELERKCASLTMGESHFHI